MRFHARLVLGGVLAAGVLLAGCATGGGEGPDAALASRPAIEPEEAKQETKAATVERAPAKAAEPAAEPRSSWREGRTGATAARDERAAAPAGRDNAAPPTPRSGSADPTTQLTEVSRELAALRVANAKLKAERDKALQAGAPAPRTETKADPADERIAEILKSYGSFKQELAAYVAGIEKAKEESAAANAKVKDAAARADEAKADLARLERDLRAERRARADAEATVKRLQEQLGVIAQALEKAGLSMDKLGAAKDGAARRE